MTLHTLVDEYIRTLQTMQSFAGNVYAKKKCDLQFCNDFETLFLKFKTLGRQIFKQSIQETNSVSAIFEIIRAMHPDLDEESVLELTVRELES